jgi:hypothetical protein
MKAPEVIKTFETAGSGRLHGRQGFANSSLTTARDWSPR